MKIVANKIATEWEVKREALPSDEWIKMELFTALGGELKKYPLLYFKERIEGNIEYRVEAYVLSRNTLTRLMTEIRGIASQEAYERIKDIFMNSI